MIYTLPTKRTQESKPPGTLELTLWKDMGLRLRG